jgi:hypothetical protein
LNSFSQIEEIVRVAISGGRLLAARCQALQTKLAHRLQHLVARLPFEILPGLEQIRVEEGGDALQDDVVIEDDPLVRGRQVLAGPRRLERHPRRRHHHPVGDTRDAERPQLARSARLWDVNPSQRPRPVGPGAQLRGELIEEVAHPAGHDVIDGHARGFHSLVGGPGLPSRGGDPLCSGDLLQHSSLPFARRHRP